MLNKAEIEHLKEIQSIDLQIDKLVNERKSELARIETIERQINLKLTNLDKITQEFQLHSKEQLDLNNKIEKLYLREQQLKDQTMTAKNEKETTVFESQLKNLTLTKDELETLYLEISEKTDQLSNEITQSNVFIKGAQKSKTDIQNEITQKCEKLDKSIKINELRIEKLFSEISKSTMNEFAPVYKRYRFNNPLSYDNNGHCDKCKFALDQVTRQAIQKGQALEICGNCARVLIPN